MSRTIKMDGVKRWKVYEDKEAWKYGDCVARFESLAEARDFLKEEHGDWEDAQIVWD